VSNERISSDILIYRQSITSRRLRRIADVGLVVALGAIAIPLICLAGLAILLDDGGPVLFRQRRVGRFGRLFTMYKLRTLRVSACVDAHKPAIADARVTRVGGILRKLSIDELPQLYNVLRGEMSIVGPRPEMPFIVRQYDRWQHLRHLITPGLTCVWQTECRSTVPLERPEATFLDITYIRSKSPALDARLILRTMRAVLMPSAH